MSVVALRELSKFRRQKLNIAWRDFNLLRQEWYLGDTFFEVGIEFEHVGWARSKIPNKD